MYVDSLLILLVAFAIGDASASDTGEVEVPQKPLETPKSFEDLFPDWGEPLKFPQTPSTHTPSTFWEDFDPHPEHYKPFEFDFTPLQHQEQGGHGHTPLQFSEEERFVEHKGPNIMDFLANNMALAQAVFDQREAQKLKQKEQKESQKKLEVPTETTKKEPSTILSTSESEILSEAEEGTGKLKTSKEELKTGSSSETESTSELEEQAKKFKTLNIGSSSKSESTSELESEPETLEKQEAAKVLKQKEEAEAEALRKQKEKETAEALKQKEEAEAEALRKQKEKETAEALKQKEEAEAEALRQQKEKEAAEALKQKEEAEAEALRKQKEKEAAEALKQKEKEEAEKKKQAWALQIEEYIKANANAALGIEAELRELKNAEAMSADELWDQACKIAFEKASKQTEGAPYSTVAEACFKELNMEDPEEASSAKRRFQELAKVVFKDKKLPEPGTGNMAHDLLSLLFDEEDILAKVKAFCPTPCNHLACLDAVRLAAAQLSRGNEAHKLAFKTTITKVEAPPGGDLDYLRLILASPKITDKYVLMKTTDDKAAFLQQVFSNVPAVQQYVAAVTTHGISAIIDKYVADDFFNDIVDTRTQVDELGYSFFLVLGEQPTLLEKLLSNIDSNDDIREGMAGMPQMGEPPKCATMKECLAEVRPKLFRSQAHGTLHDALKILDPIGTDRAVALKVAQSGSVNFDFNQYIFRSVNQQVGAIFGKLPTERSLKDLQEVFPGIQPTKPLHEVWQAMFQLGHGMKLLGSYSEVQQKVARLMAVEPGFVSKVRDYWKDLEKYEDFLAKFEGLKDVDFKGQQKEFLDNITDEDFQKATGTNLTQRLQALFEAKKTGLGL